MKMNFGIVPGWKRRPRQCDLEDPGENLQLRITSRTDHSLQWPVVAFAVGRDDEGAPRRVERPHFVGIGSKSYGSIPPHHLSPWYRCLGRTDETNRRFM